MMFRHFFKAPKLEELVLYETDPYDAYELSKMIPGHVGPLPPFAGLKKLIFRDQRLHCPEIPAALISHPQIERLFLRDCTDIAVIPALLLGDMSDEFYCSLLKSAGLSECPGPILPCLQELVLADGNYRERESAIIRLGSYLIKLLERQPTLKLFAAEGCLDSLRKTFEELEARFGDRFKRFNDTCRYRTVSKTSSPSAQTDVSSGCLFVA